MKKIMMQLGLGQLDLVWRNSKEFNNRLKEID